MTVRSSPADRHGAQVAIFTGLGSGLLIAGALGFQYLAHILPCEMCHWQRWPHVAAAILGILGGTFWKRGGRTLAWIVIALVVASGLIGAYQTGMQLHLLPGPEACTVPHAYVMGSNAPPPVIQCNVVTWSLFGLSLAAYNAIFSFLIAGLATLFLKARA
jgi:disulfide bond formation protein DsbB